MIDRQDCLQVNCNVTYLLFMFSVQPGRMSTDPHQHSSSSRGSVLCSYLHAQRTLTVSWFFKQSRLSVGFSARLAELIIS